MAETRQRILDTARRLFNERGAHRVGVREIARAAGISPGNLAYHFPTKDDLVAALVRELHALGARAIFAELPGALSLVDLYRAATAVMRNMLAWRFVLLSWVDVVVASPELAAVDAELRAARRERHDRLLDGLVASGCVDGRAVRARSDVLFEQSELLSSGWLRNATLRGMTDDEAIVRHYARLGVALLEPHCTPKGARQLRRIRAGAADPPAPLPSRTARRPRRPKP